MPARRHQELTALARRRGAYHRWGKRLLDTLLAGTALLILSPVLTAVALSVWCADGSPVLFRQVRVGRRGRPFRLLKFRSMQAGPSSRGYLPGDTSRITANGARLRRLKLDELPQLLNVLRGDMALVGPRPEVPSWVHADDPLWRQVLSVRPGLTDVATLRYRDEEWQLATSEDPQRCYANRVLPRKLRLSALGIARMSLRHDIGILVATLGAIAAGARRHERLGRDRPSLEEAR